MRSSSDGHERDEAVHHRRRAFEVSRIFAGSFIASTCIHRCGFSGSCLRRRCQPSIGLPRCSSFRRSTRVSGFRRSRRWRRHPVITSNVSSLPEVVGDAALLIDPMDPGALAAAMGRVLGEAALRAELIRRGHARVGGFSWERSVTPVPEVDMELAGCSVAHGVQGSSARG